MVRRIQVEKDRIADFCRRHHIRKLALFGSAARGDSRPDSDVDVLVLFDPAYPVGFRIFDMEEELSRMFDGRRVDIVNEKYLNPRLRSRILREVQVHYAER